MMYPDYPILKKHELISNSEPDLFGPSRLSDTLINELEQEREERLMATIKALNLLPAPIEIPNLIDDYLKKNELNSLYKWTEILNPVIGTCQNCGHRGIVGRPMIGLRRQF